MEKIGRHVGQVIVESEKTREFILSQYDETYPIKIIYRGRVNITGGGHDNKKDSKDDSPEKLAIRELFEEYSPVDADIHPESELANISDSPDIKEINHFKRIFAPTEDILKIRDSICRGIKPYNDFLIKIPGFFQGIEKVPYCNLFSVFVSRIPQDIFEIARTNLKQGKSLVNEGLVRITSQEELISGKVLGAWNTPVTLEAYLGKKIPNPENAISEIIGLPRKRFLDYFNDFSYEMSFKG